MSWPRGCVAFGKGERGFGKWIEGSGKLSLTPSLASLPLVVCSPVMELGTVQTPVVQGSRFKFLNIEIPFLSHPSLISSAQEPHVGNDYHTGWSRQRTFPSSQKVPLAVLIGAIQRERDAVWWGVGVFQGWVWCGPQRHAVRTLCCSRRERQGELDKSLP